MAKADSGNETLSVPILAQCIDQAPKVNEGVHSDICQVPFEETEMTGVSKSVVGHVIENHKTSFCVILDSETSSF
ncbi:hypothetical protein C6P44_002470 [Monosporozyma unispora]|nr:hypothetical protein C6P44_002470 [Kazachstania unispora]